jgi:hypothetical protein
MELPNLSFAPGVNAHNCPRITRSQFKRYAQLPVVPVGVSELDDDAREDRMERRKDALQMYGGCLVLLLGAGGLLALAIYFTTNTSTAPSAHGAVGITGISSRAFERDGYAIAQGVFSPDEVSTIRKRVLQVAPEESAEFHPWYVPNFLDPGSTIPAFQRRSRFAFMHNITNHSRLHQALDRVFGGRPYMYTGHNDIGIDRVVGWHKDRLNDQYRQYERHPLWGSNETHMIVKAAIYLQDHTSDEDAMLFVPGSHSSPADPTLATSQEGLVRMHPSTGDVLIFEQRSTHRGRQWALGDVVHSRPPRILISLGFGLINELTREFAEGTAVRQRDQCGAKCDLV